MPDQPKPRHDRHRRFADSEYVKVSQGQQRAARQDGETEIRPESFNSRSGVVQFRRQLEYKAAWNGGFVVAVPPQYTSQTCPCCGHVSKDNRQTQAKFECVDCGFEENADLVGAINVLRAGHARLACADTSPEVGASGQEPTEATIQVSV